MAKKRKKTTKRTTASADDDSLLIDVTKTRTPDRVSVSIGSKIPGPKQYTTHDVNMSFESNVQDGEKPEAALIRVSEICQEQFDHEIDRILKLLDNVIIDRASQAPKR